jgi:hypothetical protein
MKSISFVTHAGLPEISPDDDLAAQVLRELGFEVMASVWDDNRVHWTDFDLVVLRSTWDYHARVLSYRAWLEARANDGTRMYNSAQSVLANLDKRYLLELSQHGVQIIPFKYQIQNSRLDLFDWLEQSGWQDVVIKPAISASAVGTWRSSLETAKQDQTRFETQLEQTDLLIQPFAHEIQTQGEWSLVFFNGEYSHAVLKKPDTDDFRVQKHFGGTVRAASPSKALIAHAQAVLAMSDEIPLYARIDGIERNGEFLLLELEIHEPHLFLGTNPQAANQFAHAIAKKTTAH